MSRSRSLVLRLRSALALGALALVLGGARLEGCPPALPPADLTPPPWPEWVLRHWVWENVGTQESATAFVDGFRERGIPVGAVIIDRPWEVQPTAFEPDPARYPDLGGFVEEMHARDVRVFLWAVSVINENASTFQEAKDAGYFLSDGRTVPWWGGRGALLDYTDPAAVAWWHGRMDAILDLGIDGWKCDATDPTILLLGGAYGDAGPITWEQYRDLYYRDFFEYTRSRLGPDRVITARPSDSYVGLPVPIPFAPRDVNFAGWVGDQDSDFGGLRAALANMTASSRMGYVQFGSDIGGFRADGLIDPEVFVRWTQLGALSPIMENGGGGEHRPWMYGDEVLAIYRTYVKLHHELIPFLYGRGARAYERGRSLIDLGTANDYQFRLGEDLFVAPIVEPGTTRTVVFPGGERWIDWLDETQVHSGGATEALTFPLDRYPVYVREGAIVPLDVVDGATGHGGAHSPGHLTVAVYPQVEGRGAFDLYEEGGNGVTFRWRATAGGALELEATPTERALLFRVRGGPVAVPASVTEAFGAAPVAVASVADLASAPRTWTQDAHGVTWVRVADALGGVRLSVRP